jgi:hypothetical protein
MKGSGETYTREGKRIEAKLMRHGIGSLTRKEKAYLADEMIHKHPEEPTPAEISRAARASAEASATRPAVNVLPEVRHPVGTEVSAADRLQTHRPGSRHARAKGYGRRRLKGGAQQTFNDGCVMTVSQLPNGRFRWVIKQRGGIPLTSGNTFATEGEAINNATDVHTSTPTAGPSHVGAGRRRKLKGGDFDEFSAAPFNPKNAGMTNAENIANLRSQGINVNADGSVDQASLAKHVTDSINATQAATAAEQARQVAASKPTAEDWKNALQDSLGVVGNVVGKVGDVAALIPGLEELAPIAEAASFGANALSNIGRGKRCIRGGGPMPPRNILQQIASAAYAEGRGATPPAFIGHWQRVGNSPTLVFYRNSDSIVVGIRGTMGSLFGEDWRANYTLPFNGLAGTNRYKKDRDALLKFQTRYPPSQFEYYGVGHSLGGAILDMFLSEGLIRNGVSYNPAIQTKDIKRDLPNERIYDANDPLYAMMGSRASEKPEVRAPAQPTSAAQSALGYLHPAIAAANAGQSYLNAHALTNFSGGKKKRLTKVSLFS